MNASKRQKYFQAGLIFAMALLLWNPLPANSFSQMGAGAGSGGGDKAGGITMHEVSGRVVETMNSGGYTYALVDRDGTKTWVALPKSRVVVGSEITCQPGMIMNNFSSPSLNRTFKQIVFSRGITSTSATAAPPGETPAPEETPPMPRIKEPKDWKDF